MKLCNLLVWTALALVVTLGAPAGSFGQEAATAHGIDLVEAGFPDADGTQAEISTTTQPDPIEDPWDEILQKYDTNGNGKLDPSEWMQMWRDLQDEAQGEEGWLEIDQQEFIEWLMSLGFNLPDASQLWDFLKQNYDKNHDCVIDSGEWNDYLRDIGNLRLFLVFLDVTDDQDLILLQNEGLDPFFGNSTPTQNGTSSTTVP